MGNLLLISFTHIKLWDVEVVQASAQAVRPRNRLSFPDQFRLLPEERGSRMDLNLMQNHMKNLKNWLNGVRKKKRKPFGTPPKFWKVPLEQYTLIYPERMVMCPQGPDRDTKRQYVDASPSHMTLATEFRGGDPCQVHEFLNCSKGRPKMKPVFNIDSLWWIPMGNMSRLWPRRPRKCLIFRLLYDAVPKKKSMNLDPWSIFGSPEENHLLLLVVIFHL